MDVITMGIASRLNKFKDIGSIARMKEEDPTNYNKLQKDLDYTMKEVKNLKEELSRKDRQLKYQQQQLKKRQKTMYDEQARTDSIEMQNYLLRDSISEFIKGSDEEREILEKIFSSFNELLIF